MVTEQYLTHPIDWIENEIYYAKGSSYNYIFKAYKTGGHKSYLIPDDSYAKNNSRTLDWASFKIRIATYEEKQWYLACEKAGKYVEPSKNIIKSLEIW